MTNQKHKISNNLINNFEFRIIRSNDTDFMDVCDYVEKNINRENLYINGGTLQNFNITYKAIFLIVAYKDNLPIAYNSVRQKVEDELYISQIAVKKEFRRLGIGTKLIEIAIQLAKLNNKNVKAHVRYYNSCSMEMFKSLGFTQSTKLTKKGSYTFTLKQMELTDYDQKQNEIHKKR